MSKLKSQKSGILLAMVTVALLVTATFTAREVSHHKTARSQTTNTQDNVVLIERFNPDDALNWKRNDVVSKEVFVRNGQDTDDKDTYIYEDAYVRIQIQEYLEFIDYEYRYSDVRLMIDTEGNFIRKEHRDDVLAWMQEEGITDESRIVYLQGYYDTQTYYYVASSHQDANGEYGKFLEMDRDDSKSQSIVVGDTNRSLKAQQQHHDVTNDESLYTVHQWSNREYLSYADASSPMTHYVQLGLGKDVITFDAWIASGARPVRKWILDTQSKHGWAYWGDVLSHDNTMSNQDSVTSPLLESVELVRTLEGRAEYTNRVSLDAVSLGDIDIWVDAPHEIFTAFGVERDVLAGSRKRLEQLITKFESVDYTEFYELENELARAKNVLSNEASTEEALNDMYDSLNDMLTECLRHRDAFIVSNLTRLVSDITSLPLGIYDSNVISAMITQRNKARETLNDPLSTDKDMQAVYDALHQEYKEFMKQASEPLLDMVTRVDYEVYYHLYRAVRNLEEVSGNPETTMGERTNAYKELQEEYNRYYHDEVAYLLENIRDLLVYVDGLNLEEMLVSTRLPFIKILEETSPVLNNTSSSLEDLRTASKALNLAIYRLRLASDGPIPENGKVLDFAGQDWVVLHDDGKGHALVALDRHLTLKDCENINLMPSGVSGTSAYIKFHQSQATYLPGGYATSYMKEVDTAFYTTYIKDHSDSVAVLPVSIPEESLITNAMQASARTDAPTRIDTIRGEQTAFSLSISDMNVYHIQIQRLLMKSVAELGSSERMFYVGLRSPGTTTTTRSVVKVVFNSSNQSFIRNDLDTGLSVNYSQFPMIPCMWIKIGS